MRHWRRQGVIDARAARVGVADTASAISWLNFSCIFVWQCELKRRLPICSASSGGSAAPLRPRTGPPRPAPRDLAGQARPPRPAPYFCAAVAPYPIVAL